MPVASNIPQLTPLGTNSSGHLRPINGNRCLESSLTNPCRPQIDHGNLQPPEPLQRRRITTINQFDLANIIDIKFAALHFASHALKGVIVGVGVFFFLMFMLIVLPLWALFNGIVAVIDDRFFN